MLTTAIACIRRHWLGCAFAAVLAALAAFGLSLLMTPIYRIELTLAPAVDATTQGASMLGGLSGLVAAAGLSPNVAQAKNEALATLRSRTFIAEYIQERKLLPLLFPESLAPDGRPSVDGVDPPTMNQAVDRFLLGILMVTDDARSGLVTLRVDYEDPRLGLEWARDLVARVNEVARARDIKEAEESIRYLDQELGKTAQVSTRDAIGRVLQEQLQKSAMANVRREYVFRVLEPGMLPDRPVRPRTLRMVLAGFLLGGFVVAFFFCAREGVFSPVRD